MDKITIQLIKEATNSVFSGGKKNLSLFDDVFLERKLCFAEGIENEQTSVKTNQKEKNKANEFKRTGID